MELPPRLSILHQPVRLKIMGLLYQHRDVSYTKLRNLLELTDGNLASHANKLAEIGYLEARRALTREGFELRYQITVQGSDAFRQYLSLLRQFLEALDPPTLPGDPA